MEKSRSWFASSATGGVVYNCGATVEVNVKSMDGAGIFGILNYSLRSECRNPDDFNLTIKPEKKWRTHTQRHTRVFHLNSCKAS